MHLWEGARGQQRSALRPFLTSALALRPFLTSPLSAQTLSFRSALHPFAISAQRSYLILDRRSALKTFISFQRSALKAIFQNRSALKDPPWPPPRNFDVMALWRSITLFSKTLCVISTFQKRFSVIAPTNLTLCVIGVFSSDVMALWYKFPKKALWRYGCFQKSVMAL